MEQALKVLAIVQARMGSIRLPGKVMRDVGGMPILELLLTRLVRSQSIDQVIVATTINSIDDCIEQLAQELGFETFRGSENDVLERLYTAAEIYGGDIIVRITGDCPLVDPAIVDSIVGLYKIGNVDYVSNTNPPTFPDGLDVEVFSFSALQRTHLEADTRSQREHVTQYIRESDTFSRLNFQAEHDHSELRWTLDEEADFRVIQEIVDEFYPRSDFLWSDVIENKQNRHSKNDEINEHVRNEGSKISSGQKLWKRAKMVIPGGNMLLSKRPEMFLPQQWPTYFTKAKGCKIWDLDGNEYIDMSIMGIGTNILGYGKSEVDDAVLKTIDAGNMSTLNCPEEVFLAEKLIEMHPWADMVRFARSGGEANAIAVRIARAAAGRTQVAICGYHGWHDWYLAANLGNEEVLAGHLLPGLEPNGVPEGLKGTVIPFEYNNLEQLKQLIAHNQIGVIVMEVARSAGPKDDFLNSVRLLATENNIVLVFDECTSGFRQTFGGLHKLYGVEPDMAMFGKALGNGYAITAVIGRREIMEAAQSTFISSTFWTERIGPTAAIATLAAMERIESWNQITDTGHEITKGWIQLAHDYGLGITTSGLPSLTCFNFESSNALAYKTLVTQDLLDNGFLASNSVYVCTEHKPNVIDEYFTHLAVAFNKIRMCEEGLEVNSILRGPVCDSGFKRLA